ncbi:hypothetical protein NKH10_31310 [Mesorhizobium sp. M1340]
MDENYVYGERPGLQLVRMAIEMTCPAGVLPSEEAVNCLYRRIKTGKAEPAQREIGAIDLPERSGEGHRGKRYHHTCRADEQQLSGIQAIGQPAPEQPAQGHADA